MVMIMRILYIDIDALRPDHLGCYDYLRNTSPAIDAIAADGVRLTNCYTSDAPCLPSRSALFSGCFGIHNGAVAHGGQRAERFNEGPSRGFVSRLGNTSWPALLHKLGMHTVAMSSFADRHSAFHYYAGFDEVHQFGKRGHEIVDDMLPTVQDWLTHHGTNDNWFMHLNLWDVHAPYRTPIAFGHPFADEPYDDWQTETMRAEHWSQPGLRSAQDPMTVLYTDPVKYPRQPQQFDSMQAVRRMHDGYDTAILYIDTAIARLRDQLIELGIWDETAIIISSDHGETLGELNGYAGHHLADHCTTNVPMIIRWPGVTDEVAGQSRDDLHYALDMAATVIELMGGQVPDHWDGTSFASTLTGKAEEAGRAYLVMSQLAQVPQRSVRFRDAGRELIAIHTHHPCMENLPEWMVFDIATDPHQTTNLANAEPDLTTRAAELLNEWTTTMLANQPAGDPIDTVLHEGPTMTRNREAYLERLRTTDRARWADVLEVRD